MKMGPPLAMIGLLLVGAWLVSGPRTRVQDRVWPDSTMHEILNAGERGYLESHLDPETGQWRFVTHLRNGAPPSSPLTAEQVKPFLGEDGLRQATVAPQNAVLRFFKITSWTNLIWITLGLAGQIAFSGRMLVQWLVSERRGQSTIPIAFWYMSLFGGIALFAYFVWRQDFVGVLGQAPGVVIYARNLRLIRKTARRRATESAARTPA